MKSYVWILSAISFAMVTQGATTLYESAERDLEPRSGVVVTTLLAGCSREADRLFVEVWSEAVAEELAKRYPDIPYGVANVKPNLTEGMPLVPKTAFSVWVDAFGIHGEFSDNHFTLLPSEPRTLTFTPRDPKTTFNDFKKYLTVKHIRETY